MSDVVLLTYPLTRPKLAVQEVSRFSPDLPLPIWHTHIQYIFNSFDFWFKIFSWHYRIIRWWNNETKARSGSTPYIKNIRFIARVCFRPLQRLSMARKGLRGKIRPVRQKPARGEGNCLDNTRSCAIATFFRLLTESVTSVCRTEPWTRFGWLEEHGPPPDAPSGSRPKLGARIRRKLPLTPQFLSFRSSAK